MDRKKRSEQMLQDLGIPINTGLPTISSEKLRSPKTVAERSRVLYIVALCAEGTVSSEGLAFLEGHGLWPNAVTPKEQAFLCAPTPTAQDMVQFVWRYESLWVLLWAMGQIETLRFPDQLCDTDQIAEIILGLPSHPQLRPATEILDAADLTYRCHWATVENQLRGNSSDSLDPGVVCERHYAFNWLLCHQNQAWDDVTTDT
jgi:hypothetical protein